MAFRAGFPVCAFAVVVAACGDARKVDHVTTASECSRCHGSADGPAPPRSATGMTATSDRGVGAHQQHLRAGALRGAIACEECHVVPTSVDAHVDGRATITWGGLASARGARPVWDRERGTCSGTWCHGGTGLGGGSNTAPAWTAVGEGQTACGTCHGAPPPPPHPSNRACARCHADTVLAGGAIDVAGGHHIDAVVDAPALGCSTCHGSDANAAPPLASTGAEETSAVEVGAHQAHVRTGAIRAALGCDACHAVPTAMLHADGKVDLSWSALAGSVTWDRRAGTCSTYCHGATLAAGGTNTLPVWTRVGEGQAACGTCHGNPPPAPHPASTACSRCHPDTVNAAGEIVVAGGRHVNGAVDVGPLGCTTCHGSDANPAPPLSTTGESSTSAIAVGAHQAHVTTGAIRTALGCDACHAVPTAMLHADGKVDLSWSALAGSVTWDRRAGTCSTYCHGATLAAGGTNTLPVWTRVGEGQAACGTCHGNPPPAPHPASRACSLCHPDTVNAAGEIVVASGRHVNGVLDLNVGLLGCASCHGSDANPAPPLSTTGESSTAAIAVGAHQAHVRTGAIRAKLGCDACHAVPSAMLHADGKVDLSWSPLAGSVIWDRGAGTCATYCHGATLAAGGTNTLPVWTQVGTGQTACGTCHGNPPPAPHPAQAACSGCHPETVGANGAILVSGGRHINGVVDASGAAAHALPFTGHAAAALAGIAACTACHGADYGGGTAESCNACHATSVAASAPDWKTNCTFCHGTRTANVTTATATAAPPQAVASGGDQSRTNPKVGAHQAHLSRGTVATALPCGSCHAVPSQAAALTHFTGGGAQAAVAFSSLATKGVANPAYSGGTCAVYCHGSGTEFPGNASGTASPGWTSAGVTCTTCHGNPPASGPTISGQPAHAFHVAAGAACTTCHPVPPGELGWHVNGAKDVVVQPSAGGSVTITGWDCTACHSALGIADGHPMPYVAGHTTAALSDISSCASCHGADYAGGSSGVSCNACHATSVAAGAPDWKTNCTFCHGARTAGVTTATPSAAPPVAVDRTTNPAKVGAHQSHLAAGTYAAPQPCTSCHAVPDGTSALLHFGDDGRAAIAFSAAAVKGVTNATYAGEGGTCAVYCHGSGTEFSNAAGKVSPAWTASSIACGDCHGLPPASGPTYLAPNAHEYHVSRGATCSQCHHNYTVSTVDTTAHVNGHKDVVVVNASDSSLVTISGWDCVTCHDASGVPSASHPVPYPTHTADALANITSCTACHGTDYGGALNSFATSCNDCHLAQVPASAPDWKTNCTFCHGTRTADVSTATAAAAPPVTVDRTSTAAKVGAHQAHLAQGRYADALPCSSCHVVPVGAQALTHFTGGAATVEFSVLAGQGVPSPGPSYAGGGGSCAVYCHGSGDNVSDGSNRTPEWTSTGLSCNACHTTNPTSGLHQFHLSQATPPSCTGNWCQCCHPGYSAVPPGTVNRAFHMNGTLEAQPNLLNGTIISGWPPQASCSKTLGGCHPW